MKAADTSNSTPDVTKPVNKINRISLQLDLGDHIEHQISDSQSSELKKVPSGIYHSGDSEMDVDTNDDSDLNGCRTASSDRGPDSCSETRRKHFISYPPSPLSTDFETTDSSDIGNDIKRILPSDLAFSEQEQNTIRRTRTEANDAHELQRVKTIFNFFLHINSIFY